MTKFVSPVPVLLSLLLAACAAENAYHSSGTFNVPSSSQVSVSSPQARVQTADTQIQPNVDRGGEVKVEPSREPEKKKAIHKSDDRKALVRKKPNPRVVEEEKSVVLREADGQGQEMSLFIRRDEGDEDDLTSLLTADYLRQFDIPIVFNDAVQYYVRYFSTDKRKVMANWLKRSKRYVPMIKEILREQGLPEDLIYLAMIESGFNPKAYSSMKACGPWQFIYETGGRYGLRVDHWVDQRRDPEKSTVAAALYLKDLFNQFGNWYLAAAGYNSGEKRIEKAIERHETSDFWELSKYNTLPRETREYVPRLLAAAIIAKDPERFGFININFDQPIRFVTEKVPGATPLTVVAKASSTDVTTLRGLNPELLTGMTPPDADDYSLKLPDWVARSRFRENLKIALEEENRVQQVVPYTVRKRDTLASVMKLHRVTFDQLQLVNNCDNTLVAKQGSVIYIPKFSKEADDAEVEEAVAVARISAPIAGREPKPEAQAPVKRTRADSRKAPPIVSVAAAEPRTDFHIVRKGEKLADISEKYGITVAALKEFNRLKKNRIRPNMRLELTSARMKKSEKSARPAVYRTSKKSEVLSGTAEKYGTRSVREKSKPRKKLKPGYAGKSRTKPGKVTRARRG